MHGPVYLTNHQVAKLASLNEDIVIKEARRDGRIGFAGEGEFELEIRWLQPNGAEEEFAAGDVIAVRSESMTLVGVLDRFEEVRGEEVATTNRERPLTFTELYATSAHGGPSGASAGQKHELSDLRDGAISIERVEPDTDTLIGVITGGF